MIHQRAVALLLAIVIALSSCSPVFASELDEKRAQLRMLEKKIEAQRKLISSAKKKEKSVLSEISRLEREISRTQNEIDTLEKKEKAVSRNIELTTNDINRAERHLAERTQILNERLVRIYKAGDISYLEILFSAASFSELLINWDLLKHIINQDKQLIAAITAERNELERKKQELEQNREQLRNIKQEKSIKEEQLENTNEQKKDTLAAIQRERKKYEEALEELERESKELEQIILRLQSSKGEYHGTGIFTWPLPGYHRITSDYGWRYHPILHEYRMHTGIDIAAPKGTKIVAADSGKVIYQGYMGGYGNVIIVDHGNGKSTLYAHMSAFTASEGQMVTKGEQIGKVGSTGWSTGPHLHFEVRINGSPVNPWSYL